MGFKVGLVSLGCAKNRIDSEIMLGYLDQGGYEFVSDPAHCDILIINTCGFIESAKEESIETILDMAEYKSGKCTTLVVTGCLSQRYMEELKVELPEVDIFLGVDDYDKLVGLINERYLIKADNKFKEKRILTTSKHSAYIRIAEGCDNHCTFCIIPKIRGKYKSRRFEAIIDEAMILRNGGAEEIVVIAQDTTQYGLDNYGKKRLPELLSAIAKLGFKWVRLLYTYPNDIDDELLETICSHDNICKYLDIPFQHASNSILKKMNRNITVEEMSELLIKVRSYNTEFVIRSTFIVGFPGETQDDFQKLLDFLDKSKLDRVGAFAYSREEGTPSAEFDDQIPQDIVLERLERLMNLQERISQNKLKKRIGTKVEVLIEEYDRENNMYFARSYAESPEIDGCILIESKEQLGIGDFVLVDIIDSLEHDLIGIVAK